MKERPTEKAAEHDVQGAASQVELGQHISGAQLKQIWRHKVHVRRRFSLLRRGNSNEQQQRCVEMVMLGTLTS